MEQKKLIFLGTGISQGVPIIGCDCEICSSPDVRDKRLRTSALLQINGKNVLFDTGADFRQQMLREHITNIDAVLFTHEHRDHTGGLDELRPMTWAREAPIPIYAEQRVLEYLNAAFPHILGKGKYPGGARLKEYKIGEQPFFVDGVGEVIPIRVTHFENLPILGYRIGDFAYITDCKHIDKKNVDKLRGVKILVLNALGRNEHPSHLSLSEALEIISELHPERAFLTHIGHKMGLYEEVQKELPSNVSLAYDGLHVLFE